MVDKNSIDIAVNSITGCIITLTDNSISKTSENIPKLCKPWWNAECETCQKALEKAWHKAIVIPIPKPGKDKQDPNNYRPIALTRCLDKLLERMVGARLMHVLETSEWFTPSKSGFRKRRAKHNCTVSERARRAGITPPFRKNHNVILGDWPVERADLKRDKKGLGCEGEIDVCCSGDRNQRGLVKIFGSGLAVIPRGIANFCAFADKPGPRA
ncbi:hypothetical protein AVEN_139455-1 [Araneus ventricosus]|uniref:Reverse transcriptase domain-containing protein n=1 Tax=Araneus ventricosus TaxID=182803 RepID=A0A4Y2IXZ8_ARAVE|nr:hypothetical protein AVEN_139455-1 [Araneus ventricosus]